MIRSLRPLATIVVALSSSALSAQQPSRVYTPSDYDRASAQLAPSLAGMVVGGVVAANWLPNDRFWYRATTAGGTQIVLVDPARKTRVVCDATRSNCVGVPASTDQAAGGRGGRGGAGNAVVSPDGKRSAFIRDWNLWVRDVATGQERQLTIDGVTNFGYATDNAGWVTSDRAILLWSPSAKSATCFWSKRKLAIRF